MWGEYRVGVDVVSVLPLGTHRPWIEEDQHTAGASFLGGADLVSSEQVAVSEKEDAASHRDVVVF